MQISIQAFLENIFLKTPFGQIIFVRKYYTVLYTWYGHWAEVWRKGMKYKSWRIYLIFRALATNTQKKSNQAKSKALKSFCQTTFYHDLLA